MPAPYGFEDRRLAKLDGFQVEIDEAHERADIILNRPPYNIVSMPQRDQLRLVFETLDEDPRVRVIVVRSIGEHFSSGRQYRRLLGSHAGACIEARLEY